MPTSDARACSLVVRDWFGLDGKIRAKRSSFRAVQLADRLGGASVRRLTLPLETGQMLPHYRMVEKIGEGGMGIVRKAVDTTLDREVVIKILPDDFAADATRLAHFEHEAEGLQFLLMELVCGDAMTRRKGNQ